MAREIILLLGDMLFADHSALPPDLPIVMREDVGLATAHRHHPQKLVLFFSAMRHHAERLRRQGREVTYHELDPEDGDDLWAWLAGFEAEAIYTYQPNDPLDLPDLPFRFAPSPNFLTDDAQWLAYRIAYPRRLLMADFYSWQRKRLGVMVKDGKPEGGKWSFDTENRKPLPASTLVPSPGWVKPDEMTQAVIEMVNRVFPDHPGRAEGFRYPVTHKQPLKRVLCAR